MTNENLSYEAALAELEQLLAELQGEQTSISELTQRSQRAGELVAYCRAKLRDVEATLARGAETPAP